MAQQRCDSGYMDRSESARPKQWLPVPANDFLTPFRREQLSDDPGPDIDYSMDAFDRQLLKGCSSLTNWQKRQAQQRYSFPFRDKLTTGASQGRRAMRDHVQDIHQPSNLSSSPSVLVSSPTISALQNRSQILQRPRKGASDPLQNDSGTRACDVFRARDIPQVDDRPSSLTLNPPHAPPVIQGIPLVPIDRLPDRLRPLFKFELFNAVQSKCFAVAFETNDNIVLSAPTGSGKTVIMELALCRLLTSNQNQDFKVIYQAPTRSLCSERYRDWASRFSTLGLKCAELTGDVEHAQLKAVQSAQVIVTTPEKWDSVTRKWRDNARLMQMIKLFLVDEVHILNESRGATLEAVVSRMKSAGSDVRFVALSATVPNSDDIAAWLGRSSTAQHLPARREVFDEAFRPVKLEKHVIGHSCKPNDFALDSILTKEIPAVIARYAKRKPVMVFCMTKMSAARTASSLAELWFATIDRLRLWDAPNRPINVTAQELKKLVPAGVAFHHGALSADDRRAIERGFLQGDISVICSTSTLAVGINLPCYLVVLKGTSCWTDHGLQEYSSLDVMQMLGRAGRPQYETSACAVILTHNEKLKRYEEMVSGQEILESHLHENLIEHLNAEIGVGTVRDIETAKKWLTSSFLSIRLHQNPNHYRLEGDATAVNADQLLERICERDVKLLTDAQLIAQCNGLRCTEYGDAMARYYVQYKTMLAFLQMPPKPKISEILGTLVQAQELSNLKLRTGEKATFKQLNKENDIRYPIKVDIALPAHKASLLIQAHLGGVNPDRSNGKYTAHFNQDALLTMAQCSRLIRCIIDMQIYQNDAVGVKNALELCRSLAAGVWDNTPMQLKQIESIGDVTARKLAAAGIKSVDTLLNTEPQRIEVVLGKSQPFGSDLLKKAAKCPNLRVSVKEIDRSLNNKLKRLELRLRCEIGYCNETLPVFFNRKAVYVCFLCETSNGKLLDFRRFSANRLKSREEIFLAVSLNTRCRTIKTHVMCDEIAGTHRYAELELNIRDTWLPNEVILQAPTNGNESAVVNSHCAENFDDCGLVDEDFLTIDPSTRNVDVVEEDIDSLMPQSGKVLKRKIVSTGDEKTSTTIPKHYHEPTQLVNGNWTCQHNCNAEGKECKHQCCREGVKRPKKRARSQNQSTITSSRGPIKKAFANSTVNHSRQVSDKIVDIDEILCESAKRLGKKNAFATDSSKKIEHIVSHAAKMNTKSTNRVTDLSCLASEDWPDMDDILSQQDHEAMSIDSPPQTNGQGYQAPGSAGSNGIDPIDCDWQVTAGPVDDVDDPFFNFSVWFDSPHPSDVQVPNGRKAPATCSNVNLSNTLAKDSFLVSPTTADVIPSDKTPDTIPRDASDDQLDFSDDVDDTDMAAFDEVIQVAQEPVNDEHVPSDTNHTANLADLAPAEKVVPFTSSCIPVAKETETQQRQRLHEEDQKRRWARLPAWLYEEFGAYVDLV